MRFPHLILLMWLFGISAPAAVTKDSDAVGHRIFNTDAEGKTTADGYRLTKLVSDNGLTQRVHSYLTDANNPTGYAQVIEETDPLAHSGQQLKKIHLYGHDLISSSVSQPSTLNHQLLFYSYDGLSSVRSITNETGDIEETYDTYGTMIGLSKRNASGNLESSPIANLQSPFQISSSPANNGIQT